MSDAPSKKVEKQKRQKLKGKIKGSVSRGFIPQTSMAPSGGVGGR